MLKTIFLSLLIFITLFSCSNSKSKEIQILKEEVQSALLDIKTQQEDIKAQREGIEKQRKDLEEQRQTIENEKLTDLPQVYKRVKAGVYLIYTRNTEGVSQGSAFVITADGVAISNYHVFEMASEAIAINERNEKFQISQILDKNREKDYIIFKLNTPRSLNYVEIADKLPEIGEDCFAIGNPQGLTQTLSKGIISQYRESYKLIQTTTEITHGSSGGPLFNRNGKVIGITTGGFGEANLNLAISVFSLPYRNYINNYYQLTENNDQQSVDRQRITKLLENYYYYVQNYMYSSFNNVFSNKITRFFEQYNVTVNEIIGLTQSYNRRYNNFKYEIRMNTMNIKQGANGNFFVDYILDYGLTRISTNKQMKFVLHINVEINQNYQIQGIYENILSKSF